MKFIDKRQKYIKSPGLCLNLALQSGSPKVTWFEFTESGKNK